MFSPPPHLSPSSMGTFEQCPLKFKYSKIDMLKDDPTEATLMGNFVHDVDGNTLLDLCGTENLPLGHYHDALLKTFGKS